MLLLNIRLHPLQLYPCSRYIHHKLRVAWPFHHKLRGGMAMSTVASAGAGARPKTTHVPQSHQSSHCVPVAPPGSRVISAARQGRYDNLLK